MNRAELVEKAAVVIANYLDPVREKKRNGEYDEFDYGQAAAVVDALLPQVTTVEELEALRSWTYLLGSANTLWKKGARIFMLEQGEVDEFMLRPDELLRDYGPLMVVWSRQ